MATRTSSSAIPGGGRHRRRRAGRERHGIPRFIDRRLGAVLVAIGTILVSIPVLGGTATADARPSPTSNPDLPVGCGLDVSLVLDRSGSITHAGAQGTVTRAGQTFVDGLEGTASQVKVVNFGEHAEGDDATGDADPDLGDVVYRSPSSVIVDQPDVGRVTNWDDALEVVRRSATPTASDKQGGDLVIVVTDGRPTARNETVGTGNTPGDGHEGRTTQDGDRHSASDVELDEAVREANWLKADGSHVFVVAVTDHVGLDNIRAITDGSASREYVGEPGTFGPADYTVVDAYTDLATVMRRIATEACTLRVAKAADTDPETEGVQTHPVPAGSVVRYAVSIENTTPQEVAVTSLRDVWGTDATGAPVAMSGLDCGEPDTPPFTVAPGAIATCEFRAALPADATGTASDHVEIEWRLASDDEADQPRTAGADATVPVAPPALGVTVTKTATPTVLPAPGGDVTYTVLVENTSLVPLTITELVDHEGPDTTGPRIAGFDETHCESTSLAASDGTPGAGPDLTTCQATLPTGERSRGTVVEDTVEVTVTEDGGSRTRSATDSATVTITAAPPAPDAGEEGQPVVDEPEVLPDVVTSEPAAVASPRVPVAAPRPTQRLAVTGSTSGLLARAGAVLIAAGVLAIVVGTRRELLFDV